jgi:nitrate/TMAO reductase-like tetraheme cytochrome c subunit
MKKFHIFLLLFVLMLFASAAKAQTVYVSETGKKFHKKNCDLAKTGKKGVELKDAKKQGYEACKHCKPEEATEPKKQKPAPAKGK